MNEEDRGMSSIQEIEPTANDQARGDAEAPANPESVERSPSPGRILWLALLFGLLTGLLELAQWLVRNALTGGVSLGDFQMSRHFGWMIPLSNLSIFLAVGLALAAIGAARPALANRLAVATFGFLCCLALLLTVPGLYATAAATLAGGLAAGIARRAAKHPGRLPRILGYSLPVLVVTVLLLGGWDRINAMLVERRGEATPATITADAPNVLLLVLDTVRAESLSLYGYDRDTTPNLARLAQRGIRFDQARATAPWTLPSHASMFTGRWPHELKVGEKNPLDATYPTLAEFLSDRGYATGGFVANTFFCNAWFGLGRGFEHYDDFYAEQSAVSVAEALRCTSLGRFGAKLLHDPLGVERQRKDAGRINADFLHWVDGQGKRPFFAFLNYFDAHTPYLMPPGGEYRFGRPPANAQELATLQEFDSRLRTSVTDEDLTLARDAYDDLIAHLDAEIGRLFDELESRGILDNTIIILTSDHGEGLGEHGLIGHGRSLYDTETRVPLLVFLPEGAHAGETVDRAVSLRDIPATIADLLRLSAESPFPGASLARFWDAGSSGDESETPVLVEVLLREKISRNPNRPPAWRGPMRGIVAENQTYIHNADGQEELYDVQADPGQTRDLAKADDSRDTIARMRERLDALVPGALSVE